MGNPSTRIFLDLMDGISKVRSQGLGIFEILGYSRGIPQLKANLI